ncbi:Uncharacterised protein [Mycobacteroides abscessus subsp. abscessus]|nr:Uncharacterised protein [Mycobacteroides abscessus subsp. abscessus]
MWFPDSARLQGHHDDARLLSGEDGKVAFVSLSQVTAVESLWCERTEVKQMRLGGVQFGGEPRVAEAGGVIGHGYVLWIVMGARGRKRPVGAGAGSGRNPGDADSAEHRASID